MREWVLLAFPEGYCMMAQDTKSAVGATGLSNVMCVLLSSSARNPSLHDISSTEPR